MKRILPLIFALTLILALSGCGSSPAKDHTDSTTFLPQTTAASTGTEPVNEYAVIDSFILQYDAVASSPLADVVLMDIQGEDYQTEFRLQAFKNAVGKKGSFADGELQIVNYGVWSNDSLRFYAFFSTYESATQFVYDIVSILDSSISEEEIADQFSGFEHTGTSNIYLGKAGYISGYIHTSYADGGIEGYSVFIDCTDISGFIE